LQCTTSSSEPGAQSVSTSPTHRSRSSRCATAQYASSPVSTLLGGGPPSPPAPPHALAIAASETQSAFFLCIVVRLLVLVRGSPRPRGRRSRRRGRCTPRRARRKGGC